MTRRAASLVKPRQKTSMAKRTRAAESMVRSAVLLGCWSQAAIMLEHATVAAAGHAACWGLGGWAMA